MEKSILQSAFTITTVVNPNFFTFAKSCEQGCSGSRNDLCLVFVLLWDFIDDFKQIYSVFLELWTIRHIKLEQSTSTMHLFIFNRMRISFRLLPLLPYFFLRPVCLFVCLQTKSRINIYSCIGMNQPAPQNMSEMPDRFKFKWFSK